MLLLRFEPAPNQKITHAHEANTRHVINKRVICELPAVHKRLRLMSFKRWAMPPVCVPCFRSGVGADRDGLFTLGAKNDTCGFQLR
jgi:hypothetical protein